MLAFLTSNTHTHVLTHTQTLIQALTLYDGVVAIATAAAAATAAVASATASAAAGTLRVSCAAPYCQPLLSVYGKRKQGVIFFCPTVCSSFRPSLSLDACAKMR